jgi:S1-C subfamily serine protease
VRDAERNLARNSGQAFDTRLLFPYPLPDTIGLRLSADHEARVLAVEKGSVADQNQIRPGDDLISANGQRLLSPADFQWVLHQLDDDAKLQLQVAGPDGASRSVRLNLTKGWKAKSDLSWRPTSWNLRRMATGGLRLENMTEAEMKSAGLAPGSMALRVKHVGQFGEHATAKKAGFQVGDILVGVDDRTDLLRETDIFAYGVQKPKGQKMAVEVVRKGQKVQLQLPLQ